MSAGECVGVCREQVVSGCGELGWVDGWLSWWQQRRTGRRREPLALEGWPVDAEVAGDRRWVRHEARRAL